jgi:hypothetical protein
MKALAPSLKTYTSICSGTSWYSSKLLKTYCHAGIIREKFPVVPAMSGTTLKKKFPVVPLYRGGNYFGNYFFLGRNYSSNEDQK